jgi:hypothetical protein
VPSVNILTKTLNHAMLKYGVRLKRGSIDIT